MRSSGAPHRCSGPRTVRRRGQRGQRVASNPACTHPQAGIGQRWPVWTVEAGAVAAATLARMHPSLAAVAARQGGAFTSQQARSHGYSGREIRELRRRGEWVSLRRGVYAERACLAGLDGRGRHVLAIRALLLVVTPDAVVSHVSAAALRGLELLMPDWSALHVTRAQAHGARVEAGVRHHAAELPDDHVEDLGRVQVTSLARTAVDIARNSPLPAAVAAVDSVLRAGVARAEVLEVMLHCAQWPGARDASRAVAFGDGRAANPGESLSRFRVAELGFPAPELQVPVSDDDGLIGYVDFAWPQRGRGRRVRRATQVRPRPHRVGTRAGGRPLAREAARGPAAGEGLGDRPLGLGRRDGASPARGEASPGVRPAARGAPHLRGDGLTRRRSEGGSARHCSSQRSRELPRHAPARRERLHHVDVARHPGRSEALGNAATRLHSHRRPTHTKRGRGRGWARMGA